MNRHRMHVLTALLTTALSIGVVAPAVAAESRDANQAFAQGHYAEAAAGFEQVGRTQGWSAPLLYNLANAYAQAGDVGHAVVDYERAHASAPHDRDVAANLALTRARGGLATPQTSRARVFTRLLSVTQWCYVAVAGLWLACAGFAFGRRRALLMRCAALAALVSAVALGVLGISARDRNVGVVVAHASEPLRLSPFVGADAVATVAPGEEVVVRAHHADFVRVEDAQGRSGWVLSSAVELVVPRGG